MAGAAATFLYFIVSNQSHVGIQATCSPTVASAAVVAAVAAVLAFQTRAVDDVVVAPAAAADVAAAAAGARFLGFLPLRLRLQPGTSTFQSSL